MMVPCNMHKAVAYIEQDAATEVNVRGDAG